MPNQRATRAGTPAVIIGLLAFLAVLLLAAPRAEATFPGANGSLVLTSDRDGDSELYLRTPESDRLRRLTRNHGADFAPAWSPDGRRIAFMSDRDGDEAALPAQ